MRHDGAEGCPPSLRFQPRRLRLPRRPHRILTTDVTVRVKAFEEAVGELGRAVTKRAVTSPRFFATGQKEKQMNTSDYGLKLKAED